MKQQSRKKTALTKAGLKAFEKMRRNLEIALLGVPEKPLPRRTFADILDDIMEERGRVRKLIKAGKFKHSTDSLGISNSDKLAIVTEELGEVAQEVHEIEINGDRSPARRKRLVKEITQLAGTAIAWLQTPGL